MTHTFWPRWAGGLFWQVDLHDLTIRFELRLFYEPLRGLRLAKGESLDTFSCIFLHYIIIHFHWFRWKRRKPWALVFGLLKETSFSHGFQYIDDLRSTGKGANICLKPYDRRGNGSRSNMAWKGWLIKDCHLKNLKRRCFPKWLETLEWSYIV